MIYGRAFLAAKMHAANWGVFLNLRNNGSEKQTKNEWNIDENLKKKRIEKKKKSNETSFQIIFKKSKKIVKKNKPFWIFSCLL